VDKDYLQFKREKPCAFHFERPGEPHHLIARGMGGKGQKCDDYETVTLCRECHTRVHMKGRVRLEDETKVSLYKAAFDDLLEWLKEGRSVYGRREDSGVS
jgi:hypothetical protein